MCSTFQGYNIIIRMMLFGIILILFSCKKEDLQPSNKKMEQIYYTQEGKPYVLKTISKTGDYTAFVPFSTGFNVFVNLNAPTALATAVSLQTNTPKRIIPVMGTFSLIKTSDSSTYANISSPYYFTYFGDFSTREFASLRALGKMNPLIDRLFFSDTKNYAYNARYGEAVFATDDFLNPSAGLIVSFNTDLAGALTATGQTFSIAADTYKIAITFTYFELQ